MTWLKSVIADRPLWFELSVIVLIKVALIFCLWKFFFSAPVAKHMVVPEPLVHQQLLGTGVSSLPEKPSPTFSLSSCGDAHVCR